MTSAITTTNIDIYFPVPGADNDTQGFRNNFGVIASQLDTAAAEISDLQIIQSALISLTSTEPVSSVGKVGDVQGQLYANSTTVYICYSNYINTLTNIWAKVTTDSTSW
jgi:hypothetical protein